jgi:diguanylate cyclase (GGDEF)-like protein
MQHEDLFNFLEYSGKDPSRLIFEDELTAVYNRRFLLQFLEYKVGWDNLAEAPLSLVMMDVDHFKQINDTHGHQVGDQALVWVAGLLKQVAGQRGMPVRYAGDEFMILLNRCDKPAAMKVGQQLLTRVRESLFRPSDTDTAIKLTLSIGVASAPENACTGRELIQQADVALYYAKKTGRDGLANAGDVVQEQVFSKTAIHKLEDVKMVGRNAQLTEVTDALNKLNKQQNQFLIVEGAAGIGKTEFLETIGRNLAGTGTWNIRVNGKVQEMFRPYYMASQILLDMLRQQKKGGAAIIQALSPAERSHLADILPNLAADAPGSDNSDESTLRKGIFDTLTKVLVQLIGEQPLILLIDDLHLTDEATLVLLHRLLLLKTTSIFVCGSAAVVQDHGPHHPSTPLERFCNNDHKELAIQKLVLTPLADKDIAEHIRSIFPNAQLPETFVGDLTEVTQGNPLFLSEILRKLVLDHKITLVGQQWMIEPIEAAYLPKSLEEIVAQKIAALDAESRQMLDQVSALGGDVPLSVITGSSEQMEARVLEFIDKAAAQGLLSSNFQSNDEVVRFLGKHILDVAYNGIEQSRRQQLHEHIGDYQEKLYQQQLLPSAATLAYHFKRSANQEKAGNYEQIQARVSQRTFNPNEAVLYSIAAPVEAVQTAIPLDPKDLEHLPDLIRNFMVAVRNIKLYPPGSRSILKVTRQFKISVDRVLTNNDTLALLQMNNGILVNGQRIDISNYKLVAETFLQLLNRFELKGITFHKGLTETELEKVLQALGQSNPQALDERFWERFSVEHQLNHIDLKQVRYAMKTMIQNQVVVEPFGTDQLAALDTRDVDNTLSQAEKKLLPDFLRYLLGTIRAIKLYPLKSRTVSAALKRLLQILQRFFAQRQFLTFARAGDSLLVNGEKIDTSESPDFKALANAFLKFLGAAGLESLTFLEQTSSHQLKAFLSIITDLPAQGAGAEFWEHMAQQRGLSTILFNRQQYEVQVAQQLTEGTHTITLPGQAVTLPMVQTKEPLSPAAFERYLKELPGRIAELFVEGHLAKIEQAIELLFSGFGQRDIAVRKKVIDVCRSLMEELAVAFRSDFAKILTQPLLGRFGREKEPKLIVDMSLLLNRMVSDLIQFVEYPHAARILTHLRNRYRKLRQSKDPHAQILANSMEHNLAPGTQRLLVEDLKSADSLRARNAAQLLASIGPESLPLLIDVIKNEDNHRARQIAAALIKKLGSKAVERLKQLLVLEIDPSERSRILDIIDTLTTDLRVELVQALGDENPSVRQAAYRLAERVKDHQIAAWLLDLAHTPQLVLAAGAIKCLGSLKPSEAEANLIEILNSTKEDELRIACCRALGQIGKPTSIDPLSKILNSNGFLFFRKQHTPAVRAVAAFALQQISHPRATELLSRLVDDPDPQVREIARSRTAGPTHQHHSAKDSQTAV